MKFNKLYRSGLGQNKTNIWTLLCLLAETFIKKQN